MSTGPFIRDSYPADAVVLPSPEQAAHVAVASIVICEADPDVRRLLIVLMQRLGHDPIVLEPDGEVPPRGDMLLLEPASTRCVDAAWQLRMYRPDLPIICMGAPPENAGFLHDGPIAYLEKPFTVEALEAAVAIFAPTRV
jgi:hypothetical protein